jgi:CO/xanthine dehydrogenase FAD-binding subunit
MEDGVLTLLPRTLDEALQMKSRHPEALPIAGGTDVMVEVNFGRLRPSAFIDVSALPELQVCDRENGQPVLGAGVSFTRIIHDMDRFQPLVQASRSVGSPQIRNRGTLGGNLGTASPAGDALPVLAAYEAMVSLAGAGGRRSVPLSDFLLGPKKNVLRPDELIVDTRWRTVRGPGSFSKIGTRNAMVISVAGLVLQVDEEARRVRVALGSVGPTVVRAKAGEDFISQAMDESGVWRDPSRALPDTAVRHYAELVAASARPIDDVRGSAAYRRHAISVMAERALKWALTDRRLGKWW